MDEFYKNFLYRKDQIAILNKAYEGIFDILNSEIQQVDRNNIISKTLTYKTIQFQRIDVTNAIYTVNDLLGNSQLLMSIGVNPYISFNDKQAMWDNMSSSEKADIVDLAGYSILLTSFVKLTDNSEIDMSNFNILDFELSDISNNTFVQNIDYVFRDNKLILIKEFQIDNTYKKKFLILKNITVDTNTPENKLAKPLDISFGDEFTKTDRNEILKGFIQAASGGPKINNLVDSLNNYSVFQGIDIFDKYNVPPEKEYLWNEDKVSRKLTQSDFLISIPISFLYKTDRLKHIESFFSQIKPVQSSFIYVPNLLILDFLELSSKATIIDLVVSRRFKDKLTNKDATRFIYKLPINNESIMSNFNQTDSLYGADNYNYDDLLNYDQSIPFHEFISKLDYNINLNTITSLKDVLLIKKDSVYSPIKLNVLNTNRTFDKVSSKHIVKFASAFLFRELISRLDNNLNLETKTSLKDILLMKKDSMRPLTNLVVLNTNNAFDTINIKDNAKLTNSISRRDKLQAIDVFRFDDNIDFDQEYIDVKCDTYLGNFEEQTIHDNISIKLIPKN